MAACRSPSIAACEMRDGQLAPRREGQAVKQRTSNLNVLSAKAWTQLSKRVPTSSDVRFVCEEHHKIHSATFHAVLAERAIRMYTKSGDLVTDPFLSVADALLTARNLSRKGIGFEIYQMFYNMPMGHYFGAMSDTSQTYLGNRSSLQRTQHHLYHRNVKHLSNILMLNVDQPKRTNCPDIVYAHGELYVVR